jgi:hypothetical protein
MSTQRSECSRSGKEKKDTHDVGYQLEGCTLEEAFVSVDSVSPVGRESTVSERRRESTGFKLQQAERLWMLMKEERKDEQKMYVSRWG